MNETLMAGLQAAVIVLAILLLVATLQDLSGRSDVLSAGTEQLFRKAIELLMLALYRIFEREVLYKLSRQVSKRDASNEMASEQQGTQSEHLHK